MYRRSSAQYYHRGYVGDSADARLHHAKHDARLQHANHSAGHNAGLGRWAAGYTLIHAGRQLRLGPIAFWIVVGTLVIMAVWTITTATYFAFREDVLTRLIARHAEMQFGYEDRIAELRAQVDRISSRQLLDQEQYEQKLDQILRRQSLLESRASALNGLGDITGSIKPPPRGGAAGEPRPAPLKPSPLNDKGALVFPREHEAPIDPRASIAIKNAGGVGGAIIRLQASLDRVEQRQAATLNSLEESYDSKARRIRGVLTELGVDVGKVVPAEPTGGVGGPYVPARLPKEAIGFDRQLHRLAIARGHVTRLARALGTVPVRKPIDGEIELASTFGVRNDPFTGSPAMHTGLDLQGETGKPVRTTADGTVTTAGWSGGYGKTVDVDHGNGISTRYGHLSSIDVHVGQTVRTGQIVGRIGSTGRSTGPHLHYETRVRGEAVDPQKFLRAGRRLDGSL
jgi:murein DD-endopeptidase MepM/ murein hydrolase activator NlpD